MLKKYKTILTQAEAEIVEKKSRFIATVRPVKTEEEAKAVSYTHLTLPTILAV